MNRDNALSSSDGVLCASEDLSSYRPSVSGALLMHVDQMHRLKASGMAGYTKHLRTLSLGFALIAAVANKPVIAQAPGPELFAKEPRSPLELWDAVDYLLRTNQANRALPYIDRFVKSKPDDATLIAIRNRYGPEIGRAHV